MPGIQHCLWGWIQWFAPISLEKLKELVTLQPWAALLGNKHFSTLYSLPHNLPTGPQGQQRNHQALKVSKKLQASTSLGSGPLTHPLPSSSL